MGLYINPKDGSTKEEWLAKYGKEIQLTEASCAVIDYEKGPLVVCLVDNGPFTAAGIADRPEELKAFTYPDDYRPKTWYLVEKELLKPYMGIIT